MRRVFALSLVLTACLGCSESHVSEGGYLLGPYNLRTGVPITYLVTSYNHSSRGPHFGELDPDRGRLYVPETRSRTHLDTAEVTLCPGPLDLYGRFVTEVTLVSRGEYTAYRETAQVRLNPYGLIDSERKHAHTASWVRCIFPPLPEDPVQECAAWPAPLAGMAAAEIRLVGGSSYPMDAELYILNHTELDPEYSGLSTLVIGLGQRLTRPSWTAGGDAADLRNWAVYEIEQRTWLDVKRGLPVRSEVVSSMPYHSSFVVYELVR